MGLTITTFPQESEVLALCSVADMKENLRISYTKEDALIQRCILAAYDWLAGENGWLNRSVISTGWTYTLPAFASTIQLPRAAPALDVASIGYVYDETPGTVDAALYKVRLAARTGFATVALKSGQSWPRIDTGEDVTIVYTAGMGDGTGADVRAKYPALHKAMALLAGDYFRNREDTFTDVRMVEIDRKIVNDVNRVAGRYRYMNRHA